jgi:putative copper export protein
VDDGLLYVWAPKALVYGLGQLAIGITVVRRLAPHPKPESATWLHELDAWLVRLARLVSFLLVAALIVRLWVQTASAFGTSEAWLPANLRVIALESRWGNGWRLQMLSAAVMLGAALLTSAWRFGWRPFEVAAVGLALAMPLLGHAAGSPLRHAVHVLHNLGAGVWIGTLGVITLAAWRFRAPFADSDIVSALVRRFSPLAFVAAPLVMMSGILVAVVYVGSWTSMWTTTYGRVLSAKLATVVVVGVCGWMNRQGVRRGSRPSRFVITLECLAAMLVLGITGVLTETEHP